MKELEFLLQRYSDDGFSTLGLLLNVTDSKQVFIGYTLEDTYRSVKVKGETRFLAGRYELALMKEETPLTLKYRKDTRFKEFFVHHLWIKNVPNYSGVYIHVGNTNKDTEGCVLIADSVSTNTLPTNDGKLFGSANCYKRFYLSIVDHLLKGGKAYITVKDELTLTIEPYEQEEPY